MRIWQTSDDPTNANLQYLESIASYRGDITVEAYLGKLRGVIGIERMLPGAVRAHFDFPYLFKGNDPERWPPERLAAETAELCDAISAGLALIEADPSLKRGGDADLSDRPATRGEEIAAAVDAYRYEPSAAHLSDLRTACSVGNLYRYMQRLDEWRARKRPSSPDRSIAYEIACVLGDIGRRARDYHDEPASSRFRESTRR